MEDSFNVVFSKTAARKDINSVSINSDILIAGTSWFNFSNAVDITIIALTKNFEIIVWAAILWDIYRSIQQWIVAANCVRREEWWRTVKKIKINL